MATLSQLKSEMIGLLNEDIEEGSSPVAGSDTPATLLLAGCHAALIAIANRYWKTAVFEIPASSTEKTIDVPADFISAEAIYDNTLNQFIPKTFFQVGQSISGSTQNSWIDYPQGSIVFSNPLKTGGKLYYSAHWELPLLDADTIETPDICLTFLKFYAVSYCFLRKASGQAELRQFATKVDSGTPIMLPAKDMSDLFLKRSEFEKQNLPIRQKGSN